MTLEKPLTIQLAVQGSHSRVNYGTSVRFQYQGADYRRYFDVMNLQNYDLILGTPFMYQHSASVGLNASRVILGSVKPLPLKGSGITTLESRAAEVFHEELDKAREFLKELAQPLCGEAANTALPPLRVINHTIPLIDETKIYPWRPSRCPEPLRPQWIAKRQAYLATGRWQMTSAANTVPMLLIKKPGTDKLRTVIDLRERNKNTHKQASPLPDMEGILRRVARKKYRSLLDGKDAYEQIRVVPEHVQRTAMATPDGNMVSQVIQIGDCNAPATYQALMNYIFGEHLGVFLDVYLDDIIIYSDTLEGHIKHVRCVLEIMERERLYLSETKLQFLCPELKVLGRVVTDEGIRMDPHKVDDVLKWKTPTNRDLCRGFVGSVGYLADDIRNIRMPLGVLSAVCGDTVPFRWTDTEQRAFETIKQYVSACATHYRVPLNYDEGHDPIWMMTDACPTGVGGVIAQGPTWRAAKVAAFYSAKMNSAQRNYPVREQELLAGVETMARHRNILQGVPFVWLTDHQSLIYFMNQKDLPGRLARWAVVLGEFDFTVQYLPGEHNILPDALSRMYNFDEPGTARAVSEYIECDVTSPPPAEASLQSMPVLVGREALAVTPRRSARVAEREPRPPAGEVDQGKEVAKVVTSARPLPGPGSSVAAQTESSAEFARRMRGHFFLMGPHEPGVGQEGRELVHSPKSSSSHNEAINRVVEERDSWPQGPADPVVYPDEGDLQERVRNQYQSDMFFQKVLDAPKEFRNFEVNDGIIRVRLRDRTPICIPETTVEGRRLPEIVIDQAHSLLAHLGADKTLSYLREFVWWKTMARDVRLFCQSCKTCQRSKPPNQKPYGLLNPLPVPAQPWEAIGIDFVGPLPLSQDRDGEYDSITVVIDLLTAMVHLVPSRTTYNAREIAELVFAEVYKLHGLPKAIVSDRDVLFTSTFWTHLNQLIGVQLKMSSAYHPETDGSTERANRTIGQMLRSCIASNQRDWVARLPAIEFAINLARSESTGYSPFFLNSGRMPRSLVWDAPDTTEYPGVRVFAQRMKTAVMAAHDAILGARVKQTVDANRRRRASPFAKGDLVYISTKNISFPKGTARKLVPKFVGPYRILEDYRNNSFKLELPSRLKQRGVHPVFHSSLLRIHIPNDDQLFPGRLEMQVTDFEEPETEWAIERILSHSGRRADAQFEIQWKSGDKSWLPYDRVEKLEVLKDYFNVLGVTNVSELGEGEGKPPTNDPQVFLGHLTLQSPTYKNPIPSSRSWFPTLFAASIISLVCRLITASRAYLTNIMAPLFRPAGQNQFTLVHADGDKTLVITGDMVRLHLAYDAALRGGTQGRLPEPMGYPDFALAIRNTQVAAGRPSRLATAGISGPLITGPLPTLVELIGEAANQPAHTAPRPRNPDGGRYLNPQRAELMEEALWLNLETTKKKREWRDRAIAERKAKKAKHNVHTTKLSGTTHLDEPRMTPWVNSSITPTQTPGASSSITDEPMDLEVELELEEAEERERAVREKADGKRGEPTKKKKQG
jgi:hypothetical protein